MPLPTILNAFKSSDSENKATDLQAFRMIMTMLDLLEPPFGRLSSTEESGRRSVSEDDRTKLKVLDALATLLIRQHEITAVVAKPYDGFNLQVLASVILNNGNAKNLHQPSPDSESSIWNRVLNNFIVTPNVRRDDQKINNQIDSLLNNTPLPLIGEYHEGVPKDLVAAAKEENGSILNTYLKNHW
jgi:hypothetical protein